VDLLVSVHLATKMLVPVAINHQISIFRFRW